MEKSQAQAIAAVICRVIDYYSACRVLEAAGSVAQTALAADTKMKCEQNLAGALEAVPEQVEYAEFVPGGTAS